MHPAVPPFQRAHDPDQPGQLLLDRGAPVAQLFWVHDYSVRAQTGWFLQRLDDDGEPDGAHPLRLAVSEDVARLVADRALEQTDWVAWAETLELVTASAALEAAERELDG